MFGIRSFEYSDEWACLAGVLLATACVGLSKTKAVGGMTFDGCRRGGGGEILAYNTNQQTEAFMHPQTPVAVLRKSNTLSRVALLLLLSLGLAACKGGGEGGGKKDEAAKAPEAVPVEVAKAARQTVSASYTGTAPLEARAEAQVVSKTSGIALQVLADVGQSVRAGQVLVRIDRDRAVLQEAQADAQVRKLEANYRRATQLAQQQMVSANDLDQLRFDLENARAQLRMARLELAYGNVTAPISGVVASREIKAGNFVQINTPIFTIVDTSQLEATLNVPEREIEKLKPGQAVQLTVDALAGRAFEGRIDRVAPIVDAGSGTFRVVCAFNGNDGLQPGMFGRQRIQYAQRADALVIPRTALLEDGGAPAVFALRGDKAVRTPITLGYEDGPWVEVRSGLKAGDPVVVAGKAALRDGSAVKVLGDAAAPKQANATSSSPAQAAR